MCVCVCVCVLWDSFASENFYCDLKKRTTISILLAFSFINIPVIIRELPIGTVLSQPSDSEKSP